MYLSKYAQNKVCLLYISTWVTYGKKSVLKGSTGFAGNIFFYGVSFQFFIFVKYSSELIVAFYTQDGVDFRFLCPKTTGSCLTTQISNCKIKLHLYIYKNYFIWEINRPFYQWRMRSALFTSYSFCADSSASDMSHPSLGSLPLAHSATMRRPK